MSISTERPSDQATTAQLVTPMMRGWRLLRYIAQGGATSNLSEVGRAIDVNRVTVMRLLVTLEHEGLIEKLPHGGHRLGMEFLAVAAKAVQAHDLLGMAQRLVAELSINLNLAAYFVIPEGDDIVYVLRELPEEGLVSQIRVGSSVPAYQTAPGRALLATLSDKEINQRLGGIALVHGRTGQALHRDELLQQLRSERQSRCSWSYSGFEAGINACASAVTGADGQALGAFSVVGPEHLFDHSSGLDDKAQAAVIQAAQQLSLIMGAPAS